MSTRRTSPETPVEMTFDEINARLKNEWVLIRDTEIGEYGVPLRGVVLAHSPSRKRISKALAKEPRPSELPEGERHSYYIHLAHPLMTREEWSALLDRINEKELKDIPGLLPW